MDIDRAVLDDITRRTIGAAFQFANTLGVGFLEKVYENALAHEMRKRGLTVDRRKSIVVVYDDVVVGEYVADLVVEETVIVELKVTRSIGEPHVAQCLNYLKATGKSVCLLINFGRPRIEIRRIAATPINRPRT